MPSLLPSLLAYEQLAAFIVRIVLGLTLAWFGFQKIRSRGTSSGSNSKLYGGIEVFVSIFLVIGLWTQLAALINAIILLVKLGFKAKEGKLLTNGVNYYVLLLTLAVSVMLTGAGWFAFDLPL